jgi:hypothetical protein
MQNESFGDKVDRQVTKVKEGLQDAGRRLTENDDNPATTGLVPELQSATQEDDSPAIGMARGPQRPTALSQRLTGSRSSSANRTKDQLYADAKRMGIKGRSKMTKAELARAVGRR